MLLCTIYLFQAYPLFSAPLLWQHSAVTQKGDCSWPGRWKINPDWGRISWWSDFKGRILWGGRGKQATLVWRKKREVVPAGIKHQEDNLHPQGWHQQLRLVHCQLCFCCSFSSPSPWLIHVQGHRGHLAHVQCLHQAGQRKLWKKWWKYVKNPFWKNWAHYPSCSACCSRADRTSSGLEAFV